MIEFLWRIVAYIVTRPIIGEWLICRAHRTPYSPIVSRDGKRKYMARYWLFNPYRKDERGNTIPAKWSRLPSIRVHHIRLPDDSPHTHSHPWHARTIVLDGWYVEHRLIGRGPVFVLEERKRGYTGTLTPADFHHISEMSPGGVWTLFFTWGKQQSWGFNVDGEFVPWREYLGETP